MGGVVYAIVLSFALGSHVEDRTIECRGLLCAAAVMVRAAELPGLTRLRVWRGQAPILRLSGMPIFPPLIDEQYQ